MKRVIVVGGGAAGMMAAIAAAESGDRVILYEKNEKLGKKIYITGKGRCNVTNACSREDFFDHIVTNPRFMYSSFGKWNNWDMYDYLERKGLPLRIERGNRVFPASDKASHVTHTLQTVMGKLGVSWYLNTEVKDLFLARCGSGGAEEPEDERRNGKKGPAPEWLCRGVILADGETAEADKVIVATGGLAYPSTGSTGDGYRWAREAGHSVTQTAPALVPFNAVLSDGSSCRQLQGLTLKNVGVKIYSDKKELTGDFGEVLFTHFGVSGPVVLTASSRIPREARAGELQMRIDLKPALTEEQLDARIGRELAAAPGKQMRNILRTLFPERMIPVMLRLAGISPEKRGGEVSREERRRLREKTKAFPVRLLGTRDFPEAVITQGGVSVSEIDPATMESRKVKNLFFAGEVLDVDGCTGGYNLQIAWTTGHAAGSGRESGSSSK